MAGSEPPRLHNLSYAALAGQAGCVTLLVVFGALLAGLWLDARLGQRGPCVFGLLIVSVPVSLALMLRVALGAINRITPPPAQRGDDETSSKEV